jgi:hypothetical protein
MSAHGGADLGSRILTGNSVRAPARPGMDGSGSVSQMGVIRQVDADQPNFRMAR